MLTSDHDTQNTAADPLNGLARAFLLIQSLETGKPRDAVQNMPSFYCATPEELKNDPAGVVESARRHYGFDREVKHPPMMIVVPDSIASIRETLDSESVVVKTASEVLQETIEGMRQLIGARPRDAEIDAGFRKLEAALPEFFQKLESL